MGLGDLEDPKKTGQEGTNEYVPLTPLLTTTLRVETGVAP